MKKYWVGFVCVVLVSFGVLAFTGVRIYQTAPPIPDRVVTTSGREVIGTGEISAGQNVWQAAGGMEMGSIWGHGSYVAPDWTADYLHRQSLFVLDHWALSEHGRSYAQLSTEAQAGLRARLTARARFNGYDPATRTLTIDPEQGDAFDGLAAHYASVFREGRPEYAIRRGAIAEEQATRRLSAFFFLERLGCRRSSPGG